MPIQLCIPGVAPPPRPTDRLFFALRPELDDARRIRERGAELRQSHGLQGRLLEIHELHLSLQHLGDHIGFPRGWIQVAHRAAESLDFPAFDLRLDRVLTFKGRDSGPRERACVLTSTNDANARELHLRLGVAMRSCGLPARSWSFTPHVTLLYDRTILAERPIDPITLRVCEFEILHRHIGTKLPYEVQGRWRLRGAAQR